MRAFLIASLLVVAAIAGTNEKGHRCLTLFVSLSSLPAGLKFLEENKGKEGVISLASGMQYKVLRAGEVRCVRADSRTILCTMRSVSQLTYCFAGNKPSHRGFAM